MRQILLLASHLCPLSACSGLCVLGLENKDCTNVPTAVNVSDLLKIISLVMSFSNGKLVKSGHKIDTRYSE